MIINKLIDENKKFVTIDFIDINISYICALLSILKDKYLFVFVCSKTPYIGIEEKNITENSKIYEDVDSVINNYDEERNYYSELPNYLKILLKIYDEATVDNEIDFSTNDISDMKYLSFVYEKDIEYNFKVITSFAKYFVPARKLNFINDPYIYNNYTYKTEDEKELTNLLLKYNEDIQQYNSVINNNIYRKPTKN